MAATYREVKAKADELAKQAETLRRQEVRAVIAEIRAKMAEYDISADDLQPVARRRRKTRGAAAKPGRAAKTTTTTKTTKRTAGKPKYRNPETGATWTGWGKPPNWMKEVDATGKSRDDFLIGRRRKAKRA